jgi:purine-binding chemotaxis protein CheW
MEAIKATIEDSMLLIKFTIDNESFGVDIANVREIVEIPEITSVPKTPDYFAGIVNLRGEIISVIDMRTRFNLPKKEFDEFSRIAVTYFKGGLVGMIVDDVSEVVRVTSDKISPTPPLLKNINTKYLKGVADTDSKETVLLLNLEEIISLDKFKIEKEEKKLTPKDIGYEKVEKKEPELQIITFYIEDELYAINIKDAEEIIAVPEITPIPQAPEFAKGVISIRGEVIPVVDLHVRFNYGDINVNEETSIIVIDVGKCKIGLLVDAISEIIRVPKKDVTSPPPTLSKDDLKQLHGIIKIDDSDKSKIISYVSIENLFTEEEIAMLSEVSEEDESAKKMKLKTVQDGSFIVVDFKVADDIFTIPVQIIVEITKLPTLTNVPNAPSFVEGVINLRGDVVFVIDMRKRFGFEDKEFDENTRVIIADIEGIKTGLIVDEVDMVKTIFKSQIEPAPKIVSNIENDYISSVVKVKESDDIMIMLNLFNLLNAAEKKALKDAGSKGDKKVKEKKKPKKVKKAD